MYHQLRLLLGTLQRHEAQLRLPHPMRRCQDPAHRRQLRIREVIHPVLADRRLVRRCFALKWTFVIAKLKARSLRD